MDKETKRCPYCGEEIMARAKKCRHCGEWLYEENDNEKAFVETQTEPIMTESPVLSPKSLAPKSNYWVIGIIVAIIVVVLIVIVVPSGSNTREKEVPQELSMDSLMKGIDDDIGEYSSDGTSIEKLFANAAKSETYFYNFIRIPQIKEVIVSKYGKDFYARMIDLTEVSVTITYDEESHMYVGKGWKQDMGPSYGCNITFDSELKAQIIIDDAEVDGNGEIVVAGDWQMLYTLGEFNEPDKTKPYLYTTIEGRGGEFDNYYFIINKDGLFVRVGDNGYMQLNTLRVKEDESGKITTIPLRDLNDGSGYFAVASKEAVQYMFECFELYNATLSVTDDRGVTVTCKITPEKMKCINAIKKHIQGEKGF